MRAIYKIARLELSNLFYSPVAWLLLILFVFVTGMGFAEVLERLARQQELSSNGLYAISKKLFYFTSGGLWLKVTKFFYLLMPLLTMGLVSQEFNRGSIKLLFSAPITGRHIVLGKYLGVMLYGLIMTGILLVYVIIAGSMVESFEWATVLTGLLGLYLLFGLYAAIGLFMSSLTVYPIVAAIGMFALLTVLELISGIWQEYAFVREITYWLSLGGRTNTFIAGMICSEDVFYFVIMSAMFLGFAILKLQLCRESCSFMGKLGRYMGIFVVALLLGYITSRPMMKWYYDATYTKDNTLTQASQDIVSKLDGGLKMTTYVNLFGSIHNMTTKDIKDDIARYDRYVRFKPETKMDYVFYYHVDTTTNIFKKRYPGKTLKQAAKDEAKLQNTRLSKYLTPEEIDAKIDLSDEEYRFVTLLEREDGKKAFIRVYNDMWRLPSEAEISAALKRFAMKLPRVGFLSDHDARSIVGSRNRDHSYMVAAKTFRNSLINQGFDVVDVNLGRGREVLDSLDILVVSEPLEPFTTEEIEMLSRYIEEGKNLVLAGKPKTYTYLDPLMDLLGLRFEPGVLVQRQIEEYPSNLVLSRVTESAKDISRYWEILYGYTSRAFRPLSLVMPGAAAIEQESDKGFQLIPLLETRDSSGWNELETIDFLNDTVRLNSSIGEVAGKRMTMVGLEREKAGNQQRIIVLGDADCFSMGELATTRRGIQSGNGHLVMSMFDWLSNGELPVDVSRPKNIDNKLALSMAGGATIKTVLQWILPSLLLILGVIVLFRRKGK